MTELLTIEETAARLKVSERTVRRAIASGGLRAFRIAGRGTWRITADDLEAWLVMRANMSPAPPRPVNVAPIAAAAGARGRGARRHRATGVLAVPAGHGRASG